jgi:hypothetical protein
MSASLPIKQKPIGSLFPEKCHYRPARENEIICILRDFQQDFDNEKPDGQFLFSGWVPPVLEKPNQVDGDLKVLYRLEPVVVIANRL